eukprot:761586-Hanusia_phi.AAC.2
MPAWYNRQHYLKSHARFMQHPIQKMKMMVSLPATECCVTNSNPDAIMAHTTGTALDGDHLLALSLLSAALPLILASSLLPRPRPLIDPPLLPVLILPAAAHPHVLPSHPLKAPRPAAAVVK